MSDLLPGSAPADHVGPDAPDRDLASDHEVVPLRGDFDIATAADLRHALTDDTVAPTVVADFRDVTFVDSSALRALLEERAHLADQHRSLRLVHLPDQVATLLRLTDTARLFQIE